MNGASSASSPVDVLFSSDATHSASNTTSKSTAPNNDSKDSFSDVYSEKVQEKQAPSESDKQTPQEGNAQSKQEDKVSDHGQAKQDQNPNNDEPDDKSVVEEDSDHLKETIAELDPKLDPELAASTGTDLPEQGSELPLVEEEIVLTVDEAIADNIEQVNDKASDAEEMKAELVDGAVKEVIPQQGVVVDKELNVSDKREAASMAINVKNKQATTEAVIDTSDDNESALNQKNTNKKLQTNTTQLFSSVLDKNTEVTEQLMVAAAQKANGAVINDEQVLSQQQMNEIKVNAATVQTTSYRSAEGLLPSTAIPVAVGSPGWGEAASQKVMWLSGQGLNGAEVHLNPPELGPLSVRIKVNSDQVSVMFTSHQSSVRDSLEQSIPRLRELMAENGLNLADVDVSQHSFADQAEQRQNNGRSSHSSEEEDEALAENVAAGVQQRAIGLVDYYI